MADETIKCVGCKQDFIFTEGEQKFFETNNFSKPKRCKPCREERKLKKAQDEAPPGSQESRDHGHHDEYRSHNQRSRKGGRRDNNY